MDEVTKLHLSRLKAGTISKIDPSQLSYWVEQNTYLNGKKYSFVGHEYQRKIMDDPHPHKVVRKCSQVGISECALRWSAGLMGVMSNFTLIYVLPTSSFAGTYGKTRFDPIVQNSPALKGLMSTSGVDNQDVKQFGSNYLWMRGSTSDTAPISVAADCLVFDEKSFCDPEILASFSSRITHSPYRWRFELSTPTHVGDEIDRAFAQSRRHWNMCRCNHCSHIFLPDYYKTVVVPGWDKPLDEITADNLHKTRYKEAYVACPSCGKKPSLRPEHREWVVENQGETWEAAGYQVQPFDAPEIIDAPYLVQVSTTYRTKAKFMQFNLGLPASDTENGLVVEDIEAIGVEGSGSPYSTHSMGIDLGHYCFFTVGGMGADLKMGIVHMERVPLSRFRERYFALKAQYRIGMVVSDAQPYVDLLMSIGEDDPNLFAAFFVTRQGLELFDVKVQEADSAYALGPLRQISVNRNAALDRLMVEVREGRVWARKTSEWELFKSHLTDMTRSTPTLRNGEFTSAWTKSSKGADHYHFSVLYLMIAVMMRGIAAGYTNLGIGVSKFKVIDPTAPKRR